MIFVEHQLSFMFSFTWWFGEEILQTKEIVIEHLSKCQYEFWSSGATRRNKCSLCSQGAHNLRKLLGTLKPNQYNKGFESCMLDSA